MAVVGPFKCGGRGWADEVAPNQFSRSTGSLFRGTIRRDGASIMWQRFIEFIDWAARVHFVGVVLWAFGGWAVTFFTTSVNGWDASAIWIASVVAGACCAFIFIAFKLHRFESPGGLKTDERVVGDIMSDWQAGKWKPVYPPLEEPRLAPARLSLARALDNLNAEGVGHRNALIPAIKTFNYETERQKLIDWDKRVLDQLDDQFVAMREKSAFRTLDRFQPEFSPAEGKGPEQKHLEAMWNEKLNRLKVIIRKVGS